jgi:REP element-mobilizing transposase RayT
MLFKMIRRPRQQSFEFTRWGGKRKGAGRPRNDGRADKGVPHLPRAVLAARFPVLATWRMAEGVWNLRSRRSFRALAPALWAGAEREGFRLVHYAILGNHIHLLVEASDRTGLMRGMQGLGVRVARRMNRLMGRGGRVVGDRYHARILKTPTEVRHARRYLLTNAQKHYGADGPDDFAPRVPLAAPHTWLLRRLC